MTSKSDLSQTIEDGRLNDVEAQVQDLLNNGSAPTEIINEVLVPTLDRVGRKFSDGEIFVPEMLIAATCSQRVLDILQPILKTGDYKSRGSIVIGTVKGDLHDIGKNIVAMVFETTGFQVYDLGVDVSAQQFLDAISEHKPDVVALSCLLTTTVPSMATTVETIKKLDQKLLVIVGGPPVTEELARKIGADFYGKDAYAGVELVRSAIGA